MRSVPFSEGHDTGGLKQATQVLDSMGHAVTGTNAQSLKTYAQGDGSRITKAHYEVIG